MEINLLIIFVSAFYPYGLFSAHSIILFIEELNRCTSTVAPQPLRRLITPIGFGDKALKIQTLRCF
jgi:hypothetical protein